MGNESVVPVWVAPFIVGVVGIGFGVAIFILLHKYLKIKGGIEKNKEGDLIVPLLSSRGGIKYLPAGLLFSHNSINPRLIFSKDFLEYKILLTTHRRYADIELADMMFFLFTKNLILKFNNSIFTFVGDLSNEKNLRDALVLLRKKGVPLSDKAAKFLAANPT